MKFDKLATKEPLLHHDHLQRRRSRHRSGDLRGMDGSSLVAVVSGAVDFQSGGATVPLAADEAVQLRPGQAPGPDSWIGKQLDFSAWDQGELQLLADPVASAQKSWEEQLASYRASLNELLPQLEQQKAAYDEAYAQLKALVKAKDDAKAKELRDHAVFPLMLSQTATLLDTVTTLSLPYH